MSHPGYPGGEDCFETWSRSRHLGSTTSQSAA